MTPLQPLPDSRHHPDEDAPDPDVHLAAVRTSASPPSTPKPRGFWRRRDSVKEPNITTPAPARIDRAIPAGDIDEQALRTKWDHSTDGERAATARLEIWNACERRMIELPALVARELHLAEELQTIAHRHQRARRELEDLEATPVDANEADAQRAAAILRHRIRRAQRQLDELSRHEQRLRHRLAEVSQTIDTTPARIHREAEMVVGHHDRDRENHTSGNPDLYGTWSSPEHGLPGYGIVAFVKRYGPLPIPSREEIAEDIRELRASAAAGRNAEAQTW